jgi:hypothetical protein
MSYQFQHSQYEQYNYNVGTMQNHQANLEATTPSDMGSALHNLQLIFLLDISGSMAEQDTDPEGKGKKGLLGPYWTRFDNMVKLLKNSVSQLIQYDKDHQIPCYFFNDKIKEEVFSDPNKIIATLRSYKPGGSTNLAGALEAAASRLNDLDNYLLIVFTDGVPDDVQAVYNVIHQSVYTADPSGNRINVLFVRFGDDPGAIRFLQDIDDHALLGGSVDTKSDNAAYLMGPELLVLNGVFEHVEKIPEWAAKLAQVP